MEKKVLASELALVMGVLCNAIAVSLMIKSELGVSTISSVPVVLNEMFAHVTIGSWNFLFQVALVVVMALITRKFWDMSFRLHWLCFSATCWISSNCFFRTSLQISRCGSSSFSPDFSCCLWVSA